MKTPAIAWLAVALLLAGCSLAGDVTPAPGFPTLAPQAATLPPIVEPLLPEARPVALAGGATYQERCAPCHGPQGSGGGSMSAQLPEPPPDFADPATLRGQTPQDLFAVVTQGRLDRFMPPFGDSLSVAERWDVVAYLYTLSAPPDHLAAGEALYAAQCAACHGTAGQGDGPEASGLDAPPPDLSDPQHAAIRSAADYAAVLDGADPAHASAAALSDAERWAVVDYARALAYDYSPPDAVLAEGQGAVRGRVTNRTGGASDPGGLPVTLHAFDGNALVTTLSATLDAEGAFAFEAVPFAPGRQFVAVTQYQGVDYSSEPAAFPAGADPAVLELALPVYETTADPGVLVVEQAHLFLDFTEPGSVTVGELFVFSNNSDRTLAALAEQPLAFGLPAGATSLNVQRGRLDETYFITPAGFEAVWTVPPGEATSQMLYSYRLPYNGELSFSQPIAYPITNVNLLVSDLNVNVAGPSLEALGVQEFQGEAFQMFSRSALAPGDQLAFAVSGAPGRASGPAPNAVTPNPLADRRGLAVGLGALGATLLVIGYVLFRRQTPAPRTRDDLLQALADLDDDFADGAVPGGEYQRERARLKAELTRVWKSED